MRGFLDIMRIGLPTDNERRTVSGHEAWGGKARLKPGRAIPDHMEDPDVKAAFAAMFQNYQPAMENLERICVQP